MHWFLDPVKNHYFDFEGRVARKPFWMFILIYMIIYIVLIAINEGLGFLFALAMLCPSLGLTARRLHDTNMSGWWQLIGLIPLVGLIVMIVFLVRDSQPEANQYGPNPKGVAASSQPAPAETESTESGM
ncbi:MAG: DUF805 domain-containing protein [Candidatus Paceibacterota bacterium]